LSSTVGGGEHRCSASVGQRDGAQVLHRPMSPLDSPQSRSHRVSAAQHCHAGAHHSALRQLWLLEPLCHACHQAPHCAKLSPRHQRAIASQQAVAPVEVGLVVLVVSTTSLRGCLRSEKEPPVDVQAEQLALQQSKQALALCNHSSICGPSLRRHCWLRRTDGAIAAI